LDDTDMVQKVCNGSSKSGTAVPTWVDKVRLNVKYVTRARYKMSASRSLEIWPIVLCRSKFLVDLTGKIGT